VLLVLLLKLQPCLDESSYKIIFNLYTFCLFLDYMHGLSIIGAELCLKMPAGKCFAESASRTFLCVRIYLRISMSASMSVASLRVSGL
jgi:hypothetical protein